MRKSSFFFFLKKKDRYQRVQRAFRVLGDFFA